MTRYPRRALHAGLLLVLAAPLPVAAPERPPAPILGGTLVEPGAWPEVVAMTYGPSSCTGRARLPSAWGWRTR